MAPARVPVEAHQREPSDVSTVTSWMAIMYRRVDPLLSASPRRRGGSSRDGTD